MRTIKFSRHAKRRIKLYHIPESVIVNILREKDFSVGHHEIVKVVAGFTLPLKVVVDVTDDLMIVITAYPLKRGKT